MNFTITGLDDLQRELEQLQRIMKKLDGPIAQISIRPGDRESVARTIREMEAAVDGKAAPLLLDGITTYYKRASV
jgi:prefoldin subunit 5